VAGYSLHPPNTAAGDNTMGNGLSTDVSSAAVKATRIFSNNQPEAQFDAMIDRMDDIVDNCAGEMLRLNCCINEKGDAKKNCSPLIAAYAKCQKRRDATMEVRGQALLMREQCRPILWVYDAFGVFGTALP
jgi:hypothetical protein